MSIPGRKRIVQALPAAAILLVGWLHVANIGAGHDWGGDFAQYIHQAKNIAAGSLRGETGYIFCPHRPVIGPRSYPAGFPLLLAPVYRTFGLSFRAFKVLEILFLLMGLAAVWWFCRDQLSRNYRIALVLLLGASPTMLRMKEHIVSDIPFIFFLYFTFAVVSSVYRQGRFNASGGALITLLITFTALLRTPGVLLVPALLAFGLLHRNRGLRFPVTVALLSTLLIAASRLIFPGESDYFHQLADLTLWSMARNLAVCAKGFCLFWPGATASSWSIVPFCLLVLGLAAAGLRRRGRSLSVAEFYLALYAVLLLLWPMQQSVRLVLPFVPLILAHALNGAEAVARRLSSVEKRRAWLGALAVFAAVHYGIGLQKAAVELNRMPDGPCTEASRRFFARVVNQTPPDAVFVFRKPRVICLFTGRSATALPHLDDTATLQYLAAAGVTHAVADVSSEEDRQWLGPLAARHPIRFRQLFECDPFTVYSFDHRTAEAVEEPE